MSELTFRDAHAADLQAVFELGELAWDASRAARGLIPGDRLRSPEELAEAWQHERPMIEFIAAHAEGCFLVCEDDGELVGYVLVARFDTMDELAELWVVPSHRGRGVSRGLLERCWTESPTPQRGRLMVAVGTPADLTLFTEFGVMPVSGHWQMRHRVDEYLEQRAQEVDSTEPAVHVLTPERAVEEWKRLEPEAIGHERPSLHEFFGRTRNCLATVDPASERATALCWVSGRGEIGPGVAESADGLVPVVLAALDRVAKMQEPEQLAIFCTTASWWLMDRLRRLGFKVHWPAWIMSSVPLPNLDRYLPTHPVRLL
ncbi:MAG TPA: GNAT family N-acetyltransferase [Thermoleophilaceae bacterium]|nr:GNAT family N-acetyltransferase [Thermoleophilaceae bacterium]